MYLEQHDDNDTLIPLLKHPAGAYRLAVESLAKAMLRTATGQFGMRGGGTAAARMRPDAAAVSSGSLGPRSTLRLTGTLGRAREQRPPNLVGAAPGESAVPAPARGALGRQP